MKSPTTSHSLRLVLRTARIALLALCGLLMLIMVNAPIAYAQCGGPIQPGDSISSSVSSGSWCDYTFSGDRGDFVTIKMTRNSSTLDPFLELRGPSGLITSDDDGGGGYDSLISSYPLPESGRYIIRARSYNSSGYGGFTLQFQMTSGSVCGGPIRPNTWINNQQISARGQSCRYTFRGAQGRTVSIAMAKQEGSSLDSWLDLVDPSGRVVVSDDDSYGGSDALIKNYRLRTTGQYTIIARSYNNASTGTYSIYLQY